VTHPLDVSTAAVIAGAVWLAALIKGTLGLGFPPVATPLVATVVGAQAAVVSLAVPSFLQNVTQAWAGRAHLRQWRALTPLLVTMVIGALAGAYLLTVLPVHLTEFLVGFAIVVYAVLALFRIEPNIPPHLIRITGALVGLAAGLLGGATGIYAPILALYLATLRLDKEQFAATISLVFLVGQIPQLATYLALGLFTADRLLLSALVIPPVVVGFAIGTAVRSRISQRSFALGVRLALLVIGLRLVLAVFH
jgi:uncharacterized protein